ncbi:MAG: hypothetical protein JRM89_02175 [Nitrososphaerota archaeon]|jgi:hypothetical protein|nr:hypothetical protein [Nitrososphaerota archaeon]MDG6956260.1 hypothetical protein [Nitrososphaerota archaeon]MDG6968373.1 hypothetical protein [Nitrososphaerota archaeon]MDG6976163.1 hypothetical protein [Nitrososphaerota archaeon]MDG7014776.1 hypothetical protein [Nitrososphaerota archaeon]
MSVFDYWAGQIPGLLLGVVGILLAESLLERYYRWRDRPRVGIREALATSGDTLSIGIRILNGGKTPLLGVINSVSVNSPLLVIGDKLVPILSHGIMHRDKLEWYDEGVEHSTEADLYPAFDALTIYFAAIGRTRELFAISLFDESLGESDVLGSPSELVFSLSSKEIEPTTTLRFLFNVIIWGRTTRDAPVQERYLLLAEIPNFGGAKDCDLSKASLTLIADDKQTNLKPLVEKLGFSQYYKEEASPPYPRNA